MERPALQGLLADIRAGRIDILVIYKVDRLTQSLANFARLVESFDAQDATPDTAPVVVARRNSATRATGRASSAAR
jgi:ABC-type molybdate transport system substrate-binding protein